MVESDIGLPSAVQDMPMAIRQYHKFRENLHSVDGVVLYKERIVIPPELRPEILKALHSAHQGITAMTSRAESSVFWPGITKIELHAMQSYVPLSA